MQSDRNEDVRSNKMRVYKEMRRMYKNKIKTTKVEYEKQRIERMSRELPWERMWRIFKGTQGGVPKNIIKDNGEITGGKE